MRDVVVRGMLTKNNRSQFWVITGSSMALVWHALAGVGMHAPSFMSDLASMNLPAKYKETHMKVCL